MTEGGDLMNAVLSDPARQIFAAVQEAAEDTRLSHRVDGILRAASATRADGRAALDRCRQLAAADPADPYTRRAAALLEALLRLDDYWCG
jgi:hypothetical protein